MAQANIDKLDEQIKKLQERKRQIKSRETAKQRKEETRKKILIGGTIMAAVKSGDMQWHTVKALLDKNLTRENDRLLFELEAKPSSENSKG
ncbi:MAG: hypothetical protein ACPGSM_22395 [Thiolinea sp.]